MFILSKMTIVLKLWVQDYCNTSKMLVFPCIHINNMYWFHITLQMGYACESNITIWITRKSKIVIFNRVFKRKNPIRPSKWWKWQAGSCQTPIVRKTPFTVLKEVALCRSIIHELYQRCACYLDLDFVNLWKNTSCWT